MNRTYPGWYGKIPAYGDYITVRLPQSFVTEWTLWLDTALENAQRNLKEVWSGLAQTAPIWRYTIMPGICDANTWHGLLIPSHDNVGRSYPLTIALATTAGTNSPNFGPGTSWYEALDSLAREITLNAISPDEIEHRLLALTIEESSAFPENVSRTTLVNMSLDSMRKVRSEQNEPYPSFQFLPRRIGSVWWRSLPFSETSVLTCKRFPEQPQFQEMFLKTEI